jgi:nitroimidazol reductase NimA-like FMN-containing flavoprotein (pyridoxamine 5'-phosphate oxidase superfamily)
MMNKMKSLLKRKSSCVLATTDGSTPHCSLMAYIISTDSDRLYMVTPQNTKKFQNITRYSRVSLLIDTRGEQKRSHTQALTITGTCQILKDVNEISKVRKVFKQHHPHLHGLIQKGEVAFLCVKFDSFLFLDGPENAHHEVLR